MEYMGVKSTAQGREYAFRVRFSPQDSRDYTVTTANEIFTSHHMSYLDGPNVSSSRLKQELAANPEIPTGASFLVEEKEIGDHKMRQMEPSNRRRGPKLLNGSLTEPQKPVDCPS